MKFIAPSILYTSACIAAVSAAPSTGSTYNIRVGSDNPAIKDALVTVKDESATTSPNAIGVWSTGEPRSAYTLTISSNHVNPKLFECKGTVKQTHLILNGPRAAMALYDVPIGADPTPKKGEALFTNAFTRWEEKGIRFADRYKAGGDPNDLIGAGSWRACKGDSEIDYQLYWYDGLSRLNDYVKGCEAVELYLEKAKPSWKPSSSYIPGVPAPTTAPGSCSCITGVPAPSKASSNAPWIPGVPAPSEASSNAPWIPGVPAPTETSGSSSWITGVPAPTETSSSSSWITGVPAPSNSYGTSSWVPGVPSPSDDSIYRRRHTKNFHA